MASERTKMGRGKTWWVAFTVLALILAALFYRSAFDGMTLFANDGPLGVLESQGRLSERASNFFGVWRYLNWVGDANLPLMPDLSHAFFLVAGPTLYSKFHAPLALLFLGMATALLFIRLGAPPAVVVLVAVAAALNGDAISHACWGLPPVPLGMGFAVLAVAALVGRGPGGIWRKVLAGFAVGLAVTESYDVGAILSLYVAAFVLFLAFTGEGTPGKRVATGIGGAALVAVAAMFISAQALSTLVGTQVQGVVGMAQDDVTKAHRWREATQWSLPQVESLQLVVPGLFGYRMDTPDGGSYWGGVGRDPVWDDYLADPNPDPARAPAGGLMRHSGAGFYAGVLVVLIGVWGLVNSWRDKGNPYARHERLQIWFWSAAAVVSLLLAFGRHAPFYQFIYQLPFFSTIRNPIKFLHPMEISLVILFGYGLLGLWRGYVEPIRELHSSLGEQLRAWWRTAPLADRRWVKGSIGAVIVAVMAWLVYSASTEGMVRYLARVGIPDRQMALDIARSSTGQAGIGLLIFLVGVGLVIVLMSGMLSGRRSRWAGFVVGLVLVVDLMRAGLPWIVYYDYEQTYESNPAIDLLRQDSWQHRVTGRLTPRGGGALLNEQGMGLAGLYEEWLRHLFQYYRVQSLDITQMPRVPVLDETYMTAFQPASQQDFRRLGRLWQLTNTRYIWGMTGFLDFLNERFDMGGGGFRVHTAFTVSPKAGAEQVTELSQLTVAAITNGPFALFEYEKALPRAKLMPRWEVVTNDVACLERLVSDAFDPRQLLLVSDVVSAPAGSVDAADGGSVVIEQYEAKRVALKAVVDAPSILLLNDRYHPDWSVYVNGEKRDLLRCNYIMRGVRLEPGEQVVEFRFQPGFGAIYISLAAILFGLILLARVTWLTWREAPGPPDAGSGQMERTQGKPCRH